MSFLFYYRYVLLCRLKNHFHKYINIVSSNTIYSLMKILEQLNVEKVNIIYILFLL